MTSLLPRSNLNEQVYDTLRRRLLQREPGAGAKLSLHELAAELGVSRSPVHHALTRLVSEGLLSVKARRGYYVTPVTPAVVTQGYDVRLALESHEEWDITNAAFHECQIDLARNELLSRFYRALSVNLMMQVIRGGRVEGGETLATEHAAIVDAFEAEDLEAASEAIRTHIDTGRQIALDAIDRAGGVL
jgi:DNA-binding GntR family transcriptional regulator